MRIRPGSLMIRLLALFFGLMTAYGTYLNLSRQPIGDSKAAASQAQPAAASTETPAEPNGPSGTAE